MTQHDPGPRSSREPSSTQESAQQGQPGVIDEVDDTLRKLMPWAVSFLLHAGIVAVAMVLVWTTFQAEIEEKPPASTAFVDTPTAPSPLQAAVNEPTEDPNPTSLTTTPDTSPFNAAPAPIQPVNMNMAGFNQPTINRTPGFDRGAGQPGIPGGPEIIFPPIAATKIVFVIDASGSLIDTFPFVVNEIRQTLHAMGRARAESDRPYEFAVLFFRNGSVVELGGQGTGLPRGLKPATPVNIAKALDWLRPGGSSVGPGGKTDPLPAIKLALSYNPQAVVLLSDNITGQGIHALDPEGLIDAVLDARGNRRITIDTVQFLYPDVAESYGRTGTLERLSKETGGQYRFVPADALNLR